MTKYDKKKIFKTGLNKIAEKIKQDNSVGS